MQEEGGSMEKGGEVGEENKKRIHFSNKDMGKLLYSYQHIFKDDDWQYKNVADGYIEYRNVISSKGAKPLIVARWIDMKKVGDEIEGTLVIIDDSPSSPLVKWLVKNRYMTKEESYKLSAGGRLSPAKQKIKSRIDKLTSSVEKMAGKTKDVVQKKIDQLQKQLDYNPTAKERAQANQGKFAMDVPTAYSKSIYKKLWSMGILPRIHKLNGSARIVVNNKTNLDKAYKVYSDIAGKVPPLSKISSKL